MSKSPNTSLHLPLIRKMLIIMFTYFHNERTALEDTNNCNLTIHINNYLNTTPTYIHLLYTKKKKNETQPQATTRNINKKNGWIKQLKIFHIHTYVHMLLMAGRYKIAIRHLFIFLLLPRLDILKHIPIIYILYKYVEHYL